MASLTLLIHAPTLPETQLPQSHRKPAVVELLPLHRLPGVTPTRRDLLARLGLLTVSDLLFHLPRSYEDLTDVRGIRALTAGKLQTVQGEVVEIEGRRLDDGRAVVTPRS